MNSRTQPFLSDLADISKTLNVPLYIVGGTIRDTLMNRQCGDYDIASIQASNIAKLFSKAHHLKMINLDDTPGRETNRVIVDKNLYFDFCQIQGNDIYEDLSQRDFTINAMAIPLRDFINGSTDPIDPHGGKEDIIGKRIRVLPGPIFSSDPLRMLRAFRFAGTLGFQIEEETLETICKNKEQIKNIAQERIIYELLILLEAKEPDFVHLASSGLLENIIPEFTALNEDALRETLDVLENLNNLLNNPDTIFTDHANSVRGFLLIKKRGALLRLAGILHLLDDSKLLVRKILQRLRASNNDIACLERILYSHKWILANGNDVTGEKPGLADIYYFVKGAGQELIPSLLLASSVSEAKHNSSTSFKKLICKIYDFYLNQYIPAQEKQKFLDGNDLSRLFNMEPSPAFKKILDQVEEARVLGTIKNREEAENLAREIIETL